MIRVLYLDPEGDGPDDPVATLDTDDRFAVEHLAHTAAALDVLEADSFDCVLSAYTLTQTNGLTFLEEVRDRWPALPFILYTDQDSPRVVRDAFVAGVTDYVPKSQAQDDPDLLRERLLAAVEDGKPDHYPYRREPSTQASQRLMALFEHFPDPMIHVAFVNGDTVVRDINPAFEAVFGFDAPTLAGHSVGALQIPPTAERAPEAGPTAQVEQLDTKVTRMTVDGPRTFRLLTIPITTDEVTTEAYGIYVDISEDRNRAQDDAFPRASLDQALTATATGVWALDTETEQMEWHEATARLFGCESDEFEGTITDFLGRIHPVDRDRVEAALTGRRDEASFNIEFRIQTPDGTHRWVKGQGTRGHESDDRADIVGVFTDITAYKEQEAEIAKYENIVQAAGDPVFAVDEDCRFAFVNDTFVDVTGYAQADVLGEHISLLLDETDVEAITDITRALHESDIERGVHECDIQTNYGTSKWVEISLTPLSGEAVDGMVGIARDITDRKQQEQQIERQRNQFAALFDAIPEPAVRIRFEDDEPIIQDTNDAFTDVFGYVPEEAVGESLNALIVPDEAADTADEIDQQALNGEAVTREVRRETTDGIREFLFRSAPIDTDTDTPEQFGVYVDITDRTRCKRRLEQQRDDLDILNQVMRHDIRNDLQAVIGYAEQLESELAGTPREYATRIRESAENAAQLTQTARELADVMLRDGTDLEPVSLADTLLPQVEQIRSRFEDATVTIDGDVPAREVLADDLLESVFRNLLENPIQHNDKDIPEVTVSVTEATDQIVVRVADNGPGVPDDRKDEIFGKGEKGLESEGTGIGLYLVRTLINQYGGDIQVEDNEPEGAVFVVHLPTAD